ncbi:MAG: ABC transporter ATP-binding protein, partial [Brockia lithotrophica]|nr:ABC transporter ATP-binding protein [Brockia lithotrophica]
MILRVDDVAFRYRSVPVLDSVSFSLNRGEVLAVLGNNGAGKSTLIKIVNKILRPQRGTAYVDGKDVRSLTPLEVAQRVAYVSQRNESPRFTVFDAVLLGRKPYIKWDVTERDIQIVEDVLRRMRLEDYALRYLTELSGGELQKVVIARALAQEPEVLLFDEPTNNLDLRNQLEVLAIMRDLVKERKIAGIVVLHDLNLALRFADKFLFLKDRKVFAAGGPEVMTPEVIQAVYGVSVVVAHVSGIPVIVPLDAGQSPPQEA